MVKWKWPEVFSLGGRIERKKGITLSFHLSPWTSLCTAAIHLTGVLLLEEDALKTLGEASQQHHGRTDNKVATCVTTLARDSLRISCLSFLQGVNSAHEHRQDVIPWWNQHRTYNLLTHRSWSIVRHVLVFLVTIVDQIAKDGGLTKKWPKWYIFTTYLPWRFSKLLSSSNLTGDIEIWHIVLTLIVTIFELSSMESIFYYYLCAIYFQVHKFFLNYYFKLPRYFIKVDFSQC